MWQTIIAAACLKVLNLNELYIYIYIYIYTCILKCNLIHQFLILQLWKSIVIKVWINDSMTHKYFTCFINEWISVFLTNLLNEGVNDKYMFNSHLLPPSGEIYVIWTSYFQKMTCSMTCSVYIWTINFHPSLSVIIWMTVRHNTV